MTKSKSKSKLPDHQLKTTEQPESPAGTKESKKASEWRVPKGFTLVEDGESHIFIGGSWMLLTTCLTVFSSS